MGGLGSRYAAALFDLAVESGDEAIYRDQAEFIRGALQDDECMRIILHPGIPSAKKQEFVMSLFDGRVNDNLLGFLRLAIAKNRESFIIPGLDGFVERVDQRLGVTKAAVVSARELDSAQIEALERLISKKLGMKAKVSVEVDPALIGGFYIQAQGHIIDCSVKRQISQIKNELAKELP